MQVKTLGLLKIEQFFDLLQASPFQTIYKNRIVLSVILTLIWLIYPIIQKITDTQMDHYSYFFDIFVITLYTNLVIILLLLNNERGELIKVINNLSDFNRFGVPTQLNFIDNFLKHSFKYIYYLTPYLCIILWNILLLTKECFNNNPNSCYLYLGYYIPFKPQPYLEGFLVVREMFFLLSVTNLLIGLITLTAYLFELIVIRLKHVTLLLNQIKFEFGDNKNDEFRGVMMYHRDIFGLFGSICKICGKLIVLQRICSVGFVILVTSSLALRFDVFIFGIMVSCLLSLTIFNSIGQRIIDANDLVTEAIYNMNWYEADVKFRKDVLMYLCLSQRTFMIKFGMLGVVSYPSMTEDLRKCYAWFRTISTLISKKKL